MQTVRLNEILTRRYCSVSLNSSLRQLPAQWKPDRTLSTSYRTEQTHTWIVILTVTLQRVTDARCQELVIWQQWAQHKEEKNCYNKINLNFVLSSSNNLTLSVLCPTRKGRKWREMPEGKKKLFSPKRRREPALSHQNKNRGSKLWCKDWEDGTIRTLSLIYQLQELRKREWTHLLSEQHIYEVCQSDASNSLFPHINVYFNQIFASTKTAQKLGRASKQHFSWLLRLHSKV